MFDFDTYDAQHDELDALVADVRRAYTAEPDAGKAIAAEFVMALVIGASIGILPGQDDALAVAKVDGLLRDLGEVVDWDADGGGANTSLL